MIEMSQRRKKTSIEVKFINQLS